MNVVKYTAFLSAIIILSVTFTSTINAHSYVENAGPAENETVEEATADKTTGQPADDGAENKTAAETIDGAEGGGGWITTAVLMLIIIGALVFFISRRNKT
ncbi:hypothetical protein EPH95_16920 [Salicibibacter halophilus]|uniref:LPXTG cell wall anchor domain-containing protein n=1 Tax=Salicibibacter halophilus TaxID=2502791 RepID=A0A514LLF4_9BACI|nr:hypothetical protein [Salicibibacter halophilus]QDI92656.1 hypothetical protein EPH95_16920 [Salicibibacter halophilus]